MKQLLVVFLIILPVLAVCGNGIIEPGEICDPKAVPPGCMQPTNCSHTCVCEISGVPVDQKLLIGHALSVMNGQTISDPLDKILKNEEIHLILERPGATDSFNIIIQDSKFTGAGVGAPPNPTIDITAPYSVLNELASSENRPDLISLILDGKIQVTYKSFLKNLLFKGFTFLLKVLRFINPKGGA